MQHRVVNLILWLGWWGQLRGNQPEIIGFKHSHQSWAKSFPTATDRGADIRQHMLNIENCFTGWQAFKYLSSLHNLRSLKFKYIDNFNETGLRFIGKLKGLRHLSISIWTNKAEDCRRSPSMYSVWELSGLQIIQLSPYCMKLRPCQHRHHESLPVPAASIGRHLAPIKSSPT